MQYPIISFKNGSLKDFISFWSGIYSSPFEDLYADRIHKAQFDSDDVVRLYIWKNGSALSGRKHESVNKIVAKLDVINQLKQNYDEEAFQSHFNNMTAIWKIYLQHIIDPNHFPIFDQHVHRAYQYLINGVIKEIEDVLEPIPNTHIERVKEALYANQYAPFARRLAQEDIAPKKVDEALFSFGKFLKSDFSRALMANPNR